MPKPVLEWNEDDVLSLPAEGGTVERKGSVLLDLTLPEAKEQHVLNEMAKQLSAFANSGGGRIAYGLTNAGLVDRGGVSQIVKGRQPTKEWIEDVLPTLTEFEVIGVNVYEVLPKGNASAIATGKALYVIDVPDSEKAPHQSKRDWLYYVRLGSKSQPATHRIIEDIRTRQRFPSVEAKFEILQVRLPVTAQGIIEGSAVVRLQVTLLNKGKFKASNCCVRTEVTLPSAEFGLCDPLVTNRRATSQSSTTMFWEFLFPLYPTMENEFWIDLKIPVRVTPGIMEWLATPSGPSLHEVFLKWTLFADNAPARSGQLDLFDDLGFTLKARRAIEMHDYRALIYQCYGGPGRIP
jgi:hypothetical protein